MSNLNNILTKEIINKIRVIPIPLTNMEDKLAWKLTIIGEFSIKTLKCQKMTTSPLIQKLSC